MPSTRPLSTRASLQVLRIPALLVALFVFAFPQRISRACAPEFEAFQGFTFLDAAPLLPARSASRMEARPVGVDSLFRHFFSPSQKVVEDANLEEWMERFCGLVEAEDMRWLIYKASASDLELLATATRSKSLPVPTILRGNSFAQYLWEHKCLETIEYLHFAKRCEPHVVAPQDPWQPTPRDTTAMLKLIGEGKKQFKSTRSDYIRLRYAYQLIRLAHYARQYRLTLALYDELIPQIDREKARWNDSIIPWWILGHKAGALRSLGDNVEASYLFARIFMNCPSRRASASLSFFLRNDQEWKACLLRCQSDQERAALYAIRAADSRAKALPDMQAIYEIDPANPFLPILLYRELHRMERTFLGLAFNTSEGENQPKPRRPNRSEEAYLVELTTFVHRCATERRTTQPLLWQLAEGYLFFLSGNYYEAQKIFEQLAPHIDDPALRQQLDVFNLVLQVATLQQPDNNTEDFIIQTIEKNPLYRRFPSLPHYVQDRLAALYQRHGQRAKAFLILHHTNALIDNPDPELIDELLSLLQKRKKSRLEELLTKDINPLDLLDLKASYHIGRGELELAYRAYQRIPVEHWDDFGLYNPFRETFKDCIRCYERLDSTTVQLLNKGEILEQMLDLDSKARAGIGDVALHHYRLGLAFYNMSYFGYAWRVADRRRSGATWDYLHRGKDNVYCFPPYFQCIRENTDLSRALYHFERARLLAPLGSELGAKAAFQAARCQQKQYFASPTYTPPPCCNRMPPMPDSIITNYKRLVEDYRETKFYQRIIQECKYFASYAARQ